MSQTPSIAYFVVGLRLRQASVLCSTQQAVYAKTSVLAALTQLSDAVIRLFQVVEPPAITQQQVLGLIQNCWNLVQQYADGDDYFLRTAYGACQGYLQTLETSLRNLTNVNAGQSPRVNNWYELGWEVANGRNEIERKIIQLDDDPDPIRRAGIYSETDRGWSFARPERIRELLSNLDISVGQVMPTHTGEILCPIPGIDRQLGGWHQLEAALPTLGVTASRTSERETSGHSRRHANDEQERPVLSPSEQDILDIVQQAGERLTTHQIVNKLVEKNGAASVGTTKIVLAGLTRRRLLNNRQDGSPKGYGLPDWQ